MIERDAVRTFNVAGWNILDAVAAKRGRTISMCLPCRNEGSTIGPLVHAIRTTLVEDMGLVDELIVLDDRSTDDTAANAAAAGATVVPVSVVHDRFGVGDGKGNALWATMAVSTGDFIVWCDGDVTSFEPSWVVKLMAPLLLDDSIALVKASYERPTDGGGGGRTTELVARPLLSLFVPSLTGLDQPLSGEFAGRRDVLEQIPFVEGWGVEIAMLVDLERRFGAGAIAQVDLGTRRHRHRSLRDLSRQAAEVMASLMERTPAAAAFATDTPALRRADGSVEQLNLAERPPLARIRASLADELPVR